jgi:hypothetical protein
MTILLRDLTHWGGYPLAWETAYQGRPEPGTMALWLEPVTAVLDTTVKIGQILRFLPCVVLADIPHDPDMTRRKRDGTSTSEPEVLVLPLLGDHCGEPNIAPEFIFQNECWAYWYLRWALDHMESEVEL